VAIRYNAPVPSPAAAGPLDGLLVADFSRVLAGPLATMTLGDLGADVVKVERPGSGDDTRAWGPPWHEQGATYYLGLNRNKRSLALDLTDQDDLRLARRLAERADVVIESFRPGLMAEFGLDRASIATANPGVVTCSIRAFGSEGAAAGLPGYDLLLQAMSGLMSITGQPDGEPTKVGAALVDMVCGLYAVTGVLAALHERSRTGEGQHVEVTLMASALASLLNQGSAHLLAGVVPGRLGNRHPSIVPYQTFHAADGEFALACGNDRLWQRLCTELGLEALGSDERLRTNAGRVEHVAQVVIALESAFMEHPVETLVDRLNGAGVPAGRVNDIAEAFAFAERLGVEPWWEAGREGEPPLRLTRSPMAFDRTPAGVRLPPPQLDEHGDELRAWLEAEEEELEG
jgi:crotonobetainyl-CoA:carnitine CoA-transferase CaiB-like acyl-CoA transferase